MIIKGEPAVLNIGQADKNCYYFKGKQDSG